MVYEYDIYEVIGSLQATLEQHVAAFLAEPHDTGTLTEVNISLSNLRDTVRAQQTLVNEANRLQQEREAVEDKVSKMSASELAEYQRQISLRQVASVERIEGTATFYEPGDEEA